MMTFLIILGSIIALIVGGTALYRSSKRRDMATWQVGDKLTAYGGTALYNYMRHFHADRATLRAWSDKDILVEVGGNIYNVKYGDISHNKGAEHRAMEARIRETMKKPDFNLEKLVESAETKGDEFFDGKHLELLNETELNIYLKKALTQDKYEYAAQIRDQLKKYR